MQIDTGIKETLDTIFAGVLVGGIDTSNKELMYKKRDVYKVALNRFIGRFKFCVFFEEYAIFWNLVKERGIKAFTRSNLELVLENNVDIILASKYIDWSPWVSIQGRPTTDEEKFVAYKEKVLRAFDRLSNMYVDEDAYDTAIKVYVDWYTNQLQLETAQKMTLILTDGIKEKVKGRTKSYKGLADSQVYYREKQSIIESLIEDNHRNDYAVDESWLETELTKLDSKRDETSLFKTGIEPIDNSIKWIRRGRMYNILGAPKGGKTSLSNHLVAEALENGLNVAVWAVEGSSKDWEHKQEAHIIFKQYALNAFLNSQNLDNSNKNGGVIVVNSDSISNPSTLTQEEKEAVVSATTLLATDPKRGKLSFIEGTAYVEDFRDKILAHYKEINPFDVLVIDSPINFLSLTGKSSVERIKEAFINLGTFIGTGLPVKVACIVTSQIKQSAIDEVRKKTDAELSITSGGESAEVIRTPDETWGLFSTKESLKTGRIQIQSVASRHQGNFDSFYCKAHLGSSYFTYVPDVMDY